MPRQGGALSFATFSLQQSSENEGCASYTLNHCIKFYHDQVYQEDILWFLNLTEMKLVKYLHVKVCVSTASTS